MSKFAEQLPQTRKEFQEFIAEGCLVAKTSLQSMLDITDALVLTMISVSWLQNSGMAPNVQQAIEDLPFNGQLLFSDKTDII